MQLNNKATQEIIEIVKVTNGIVYTIYENSYFKSINEGETKAIVWAFDEDFMPDASLSFRDNKLKKAYEYLLTLDTFLGFELSSDSQNWLHTTRTTRLFINTDAIINAINENDQLNTIINRLRDENNLAVEKFIVPNKKQTVVYVNEILTADATVIADKIGVSIFTDTKTI